MDCKIRENPDGSINHVVADNGNKSKLFEDLRSIMGDQLALEYYALSKSQELKDVIGSKEYVNNETNDNLTYQTAEIKGVTSHMFVQNKEVVGSLRVKPVKDGFKVDTVSVRENYRGQGVGTELYYETVRNLMVDGKKLYSDDSQTEFAHRIWQGLVRDGLAIQTSKFNFETIEPLPNIDKNTSIDTILERLKKLTDSNGEPIFSEVLRFSNTSQETLTKSETIDAIESAIGLGVENSTELNSLLEQGFIDNGAFVFVRERLESVGYNDFEITTILNSPKLQESIKNKFAKLKNTEFDINDIGGLRPTDKINSLGKQKLEPIPQNIQTEVYTIESGELVPKETDTKQTLRKTFPEDYKEISEKFSKALRTAINVREDVGEERVSDLKNVAKFISKEALNYGVDLRGLENKVLPVKRFSEFVASLANYINNPNDNFSDIYDDFMEVPQYFSNKVTNDSDIVLDTEMSELDIFERFNMVRKSGDVFTIVDNMTLEELQNAVEDQGSISELGLTEFNFNQDTAQRLLLWKKGLGYKIEVETTNKPDFIDIKELAQNPYKKATSKGVVPMDNSYLTKLKSELYDKPTKVGNLTTEEIIRSNPDKVAKINTDYSYIEDGVLITKNNTEGFVRTPQGLFERFYESGDLSFFAQVLDIKVKPLVNMDMAVFENNKALIDNFIEAKEYYTKKELETINDKFFNCK